jgi:single-stranded DNA-binding protein
MSNPSNTVVVTGRLARDPKAFGNRDGSATVRFTVMADRTYTDKNGVDSDAVPFKTYVRDLANSPFSHLHTGDLVTISGSLQLDHYAKGGEDVYELTVNPDIRGVKFLDSKAVVEQRLAARAGAVAVPATEPEPALA